MPVPIAEARSAGYSQTGISTAVDVTGLVLVNFELDEPSAVWVDLGYFAVTAPPPGTAFTPTTVEVSITDDANMAKRSRWPTFSSFGVGGGAMVLSERIDTPGTYSRKVRVGRVAGTGLVTVGSVDARFEHRLWVE